MRFGSRWAPDHPCPAASATCLRAPPLYKSRAEASESQVHNPVAQAYTQVIQQLAEKPVYKVDYEDQEAFDQLPAEAQHLIEQHKAFKQNDPH